ncbi:hypothetical protein RHGRI_032208 [Rhododendron griersonianum]|uniref:Uncharacterized protein n=1 Tax=Rhododendron griersonianum TaxID=479676 RepID=A0AAV6IFP5_9ERIC|nr:hypothetical protein RHGRI_032208 [Rhododendron griersonianum]
MGIGLLFSVTTSGKSKQDWKTWVLIQHKGRSNFCHQYDNISRVKVKAAHGYIIRSILKRSRNGVMARSGILMFQRKVCKL